MEIIFIYSTTPNLENAESISRTLLEENLISCANCLPGMKSIYWWQGKIESGNEAVLILKTTKDLYSKVCDRLKKLHPYQTPCIAEIKLDSLNSEYKKWLIECLEPKV